ncbi:MAG: DUF6249 domain-containing protein [candidate division WOR-3 bacterium]
MDAGDLVGLFAVIGVFSVPVFFFLATVGIVAISLVYAYRKRKMAHEQIKLALERGASGEDIEKIARALGANGRSRSDLLGGITLMAWGAGLGGFFLVYQYWGVALLIGLPMVIIGAAKIVYWAISGRKKEASS